LSAGKSSSLLARPLSKTPASYADAPAWQAVCGLLG
jgi:hypothetical protein